MGIDMPAWAWVMILLVLAAIVTPIKLRIMKQLLVRRDQGMDQDQDE